MRSPADVLADLQRADSARPRITVYGDPADASAGERIELSARVLANWVAKAANLLQDEFIAEPGTRVGLALPPHWRTAYWALATWSVGACVCLPRSGTSPDAPAGLEPVQVLISDEVALVADAPTSDAVLVTLAGLARSAAGPVPSGALDEARTLATYADRFSPAVDPGEADPALGAGDWTTSGDDTAYGQLLAPQLLHPVPPGARVHTATSDPREFLLIALSTWAVDGSIVLSRGRPPADVLVARLSSEGVTLDLG